MVPKSLQRIVCDTASILMPYYVIAIIFLIITTTFENNYRMKIPFAFNSLKKNFLLIRQQTYFFKLNYTFFKYNTFA